MLGEKYQGQLHLLTIFKMIEGSIQLDLGLSTPEGESTEKPLEILSSELTANSEIGGVKILSASFEEK